MGFLAMRGHLKSNTTEDPSRLAIVIDTDFPYFRLKYINIYFFGLA